MKKEISGSQDLLLCPGMETAGTVHPPVTSPAVSNLMARTVVWCLAWSIDGA